MVCSGGGENVRSVEKLKDSNLWNQKLGAWRPMYTPEYFIAFLLVVGLPFLALGALVHSASQDVVEQSLRYDGEPSCAAALGSSPCAAGAAQDPLCWRREVAAGNEGAFANECEVTLTVEANMTAPVYFYYELHEFFQNQRIYVKSQAARQLRGDDWPSLDSYAQYLGSECVDSGHDQCTTGEVPVDDSVPTRYYCNPCGLVARSFFTDTFALEDASGAALEWSQDEVAWPRDREEKFRNTSSGNRFNRRTALENALVTDPDFIVWMRTAALPDFRKLYRRIDRDLVAGETLTLRVRNNYNVTSGGSKRVVLSTMSWIGGQNEFLGGAYIGVGALCVFLGVVFATVEISRRARARHKAA